MKNKAVLLIAVIGLIVLMGAMFMAGYEYYQPREIIVDRWHEPDIKVVETVRYEPLPVEYIDVAIKGLEQAIASHQYYIDNENVSEGSIAWHQRTIDKYRVSVTAFEIMKLNYNGGE